MKDGWMDGWMDDMVQINFKIAQLGQIHKVENPKTLNPRDLCICTHFRRFFVVRLLSTAELFFGCCLHKGRTRAGRKELPFGTLNF
jgi:hypothetical protein